MYLDPGKEQHSDGPVGPSPPRCPRQRDGRQVRKGRSRGSSPRQRGGRQAQVGDQSVPYGASVYRGAVACSCPVDLRAPGRPPKKVQAPTWKRSSAQAPSESTQVHRQQVLPASIWPCGDRALPEGQDPQDRRRPVLVVWGRKATDAPPSFHGVQGLDAAN